MATSGIFRFGLRRSYSAHAGAVDSSDVSALAAARQMRDGEIDAAVGDDVYRAYAVPKRDGHPFLTFKDE